MRRLDRGGAAERAGSAPSSVSVAVLCVAFLASAPLWSGLLAAPERSVVVMLVAGAPLIWVLSTVLTFGYVLPLVAVAHWFGRRRGRGERRRYVVAATLLGVAAAGLPTLVLMARAGSGDGSQLAAHGALVAAVLWAVSAPAALAVHLTLRRERDGRPVRPVADIILWGTVALGVEFVGLLVFG
ncbi:hypothetical protein [Streptomyces sp. SID7909]|uniref:hypothetical protein n=1 Tax=Streptomyces sp. SID7909 TaxID=2706092 RepID=UPI0013B5E110|nr:hypothetical protein [Streptomyces sp. SID7909]NEC06685.1 hypothetical protein [Streptomyces sp. SID7909]